MAQFNLLDYLDEIRAISSKNGCTLTAAVDRMIVNLNTFNDCHPGTGNVNYHIIGHQWGALTSAEKIEQKRAAKAKIVEPEPEAKTVYRSSHRRV